ncbi:MAG: 4'-phosphopantetheinyl transferase superfamily protein [Bacteroidales bacterium]|nr:4'-phosphopantetheinyl transferase superfamily protein [Bacteroidales bacterium]MDD3892044.1 4'-phosphopantetheinyl transferase superfamily protein [Bacteroidales bacterium]
MAAVEILEADDYTLGIWRVEETEEELKEIVGGEYFPGLARISNSRRKLEWLAARALLREFGYTGHVMYHPTRRPFLAHSRSHISISHSYPYVVVILSSDLLVGVDIESFTRPFIEVSDKYLSKNEKKWVDIDDNRQLSLIWSAKEAIYKLPGMEGLGAAYMDVKPIANLAKEGKFEATVRLGGTVQRLNLHYFYLGYFNVVWVGCNPKLLEW